MHLARIIHTRLCALRHHRSSPTVDIFVAFTWGTRTVAPGLASTLETLVLWWLLLSFMSSL